jgi:hypothetical protein
VARFGNTLFVAIDAAAVAAAAVGASALGRRVRSFQRVTLGPGALDPSCSAPNLARGEEVQEAIRRAVESASPGARRAVLVLPDGVGRILLVDVPPGARPEEFVRFRVAPSLPWPATEAMVDVLPVGHGRVAGAVVARATVVEYEQAVRGAGLEIERVHLGPLLALAGVRRDSRDAAHVVLGDVALCLFCFRGGELAGLRNRRRDRSPGEAGRLLEEAVRAALQAGDGSATPRITISGSGTDALLGDLPVTALERGAVGPSAWPHARESAWLAGVVR